MRDSEIEQWVLNEIRLTTDGRLKELCVLSINRVVSLSGTVRSRAQKHAVEVAAGRARGVIAVLSHLQIAPRISRKPRTIIKTPVNPPAAISQTVTVAALTA